MSKSSFRRKSRHFRLACHVISLALSATLLGWQYRQAELREVSLTNLDRPRVTYKLEPTPEVAESGIETPPPDDFPNYTIWKSPDCGKLPISRLYLSRDFGDVHLGVHSSYVFILDLEGKVHYWRRYNKGVVLDFKPHHLANGQVFYSYFASNGSSVINGDYYGQRVVLNQDMQPVKTVSMISATDGRPCRSGSHDFLMEGPDEYIFTAPEVSSVDLSKYYSDCSCNRELVVSHMQKFKSGAVQWEWNSLLCPELLVASRQSPNEDSFAAWDYCHLNSMWRDPQDGNYLVSFRMLDAVLKIKDRGGSVLWLLGGQNDEFGLSPEQQFSYQHTASRTSNGAILVFDNGVRQGRSRVVEYYLDEQNRKLTKFREVYVRQAQMPLTTYMGSAF